MKKLAVFLPSWVGDAAMATPALRALAKTLGPSGSILGIMQPVIRDVLGGNSWIDEHILFSKRRWVDRLKLVSQIREHRPEAVVLFTNSLWTALVTRLAGVKERIGYARDGRNWLLTKSLPVIQQNGQALPVPAIDYYLQLVELLGCSTNDRRMELVVQSADRAMADDLYRRIGFSAHRPTVVINSSGAWGGAKLWPADHVEQLARRIVESHPFQVLLHCGPGEREAASAIATRISHPLVQSMGQVEQLPIGLSKAVLERASVVVSTDSGPRHLAVALNRPVISLFGPTDPAWTKTYNHPEVELAIELSCRACWQKSCPLGHTRCMRDLGVESVYGAVLAAHIQTSRARAA